MYLKLQKDSYQLEPIEAKEECVYIAHLSSVIWNSWMSLFEIH